MHHLEHSDCCHKHYNGLDPAVIQDKGARKENTAKNIRRIKHSVMQTYIYITYNLDVHSSCSQGRIRYEIGLLCASYVESPRFGVDCDH